MNYFVERTYKFNEVGETPVGDSHQNLMGAFDLIYEEFKEVSEALDKYELASKMDCKKTQEKRKAELLKEIVDLQVVSIGILYRLGLNRHQVEAAMNLVADNNLSKFSDTEEDAIKSVESFIDSDRYDKVQYKSVGDKFVVHGVTREGGYKILKDHLYKKCDDKLIDLVGI